jgi:hypothetical protein
MILVLVMRVARGLSFLCVDGEGRACVHGGGR